MQFAQASRRQATYPFQPDPRHGHRSREEILPQPRLGTPLPPGPPQSLLQDQYKADLVNRQGCLREQSCSGDWCVHSWQHSLCIGQGEIPINVCLGWAGKLDLGLPGNHFQFAALASKCASEAGIVCQANNQSQTEALFN